MLYLDIPTAGELKSLASHRDDLCVSIYLPTTPVTQATDADRIELKNLGKEAIRELTEAGADRRRVAAVSECIDDLVDDDEFWRFQAHSLAVLATPDHVHTFRVPSTLSPAVVVSDRFHLTPLLRAATFPNSGYVLALAEGAVRLVEVSPDLPATAVKLQGMAKDAADALGKATLNDRSPSGRIQGSEGQKVRLRQYARKVDAALRETLAGHEVPLILAATEPLASIYRSVNTYPYLVASTLSGSPDRLTDAELAARARAVLDDLYRAEIAAWAALFATRENQGRATTDLAGAARAATMGAVDTMLVDIDAVIPGTVDDADGAVTVASEPGAGRYGIVDEIARRVLLSGGRVLGVRAADIPGGKPLAAILRYPA
jgi:release factor family 11